MPTTIPCPTCQKEVQMTEEFEFRPFCSKRCRDIDFGEWATESYSIQGNKTESDTWSEDLDKFE